MLATKKFLIEELEEMLASLQAMGADLTNLKDQFPTVDDSYDEIAEFAQKCVSAPLRENWSYVEPNGLKEIWAECDPDRPLGKLGSLTPEQEKEKAEAAFHGAVAGCILGKPLEGNFTLAQIRDAAKEYGEWPISDYISREMHNKIRSSDGSGHQVTKGNISYATIDDDLNYTTLGMMVLENHGINWTKSQLDQLWINNLPVRLTFGPERKHMIKISLDSLHPEEEDLSDIWPEIWNGKAEFCGAQIRVDAYGYACPGRPALAAEMAWRDASRTHRRTGIYAAMFTAAAIACAFAAEDRLEPFELALKFVPKKSRFYEITADCLEMVRESSDWLEAYKKINDKYGIYGHCKIYQETGFLINAMKFAENTGDGFCKAVSQGADTDCYGEIAGSLLGAYFGHDGLEERWISVFNDDFRVGLVWFFERSLGKVAERMGRLPALTESRLDQSSKTARP